MTQPPIRMNDEDNDDAPIGRVLTRREMLTILGGASAALFVGYGISKALAQTATVTPSLSPTATSVPTCVVVPELTEGPYFVDEMLNRMDIRTDPETGIEKEGVRLTLIFRVSQVGLNTCVPLEGAQVDIWHCDAAGLYSDVRQNNTLGQKFLRGYQVTDENGIAQFITIYPGWYSGRTVHIHFKIRTDPQNVRGYDFTSQLFFDEAMTDAIYQLEPYNQRPNRNMTNARDNIFNNSDGLLTLELVEDEDGEGYTATFDIGLQITS